MEFTAIKAPLSIVVADLLRDDYNYLNKEITYTAENPGYGPKYGYCKIEDIILGSVYYWLGERSLQCMVQVPAIELIIFADRHLTQELLKFSVPTNTLRQFVEEAYPNRLTGLGMLRMIETQFGGLSGTISLQPTSIPQPA